MRRRLESAPMIAPPDRPPLACWRAAQAARRVLSRRTRCRDSIRNALIVSGALAGHLLIPLAAGAQDVTAPALKAAFIYNFVKFTEWPAVLTGSEPFVICVIGDAAVGDALARAVEGREVAGRRMLALVVISPPARVCGVLYVSGMPVRDASRTIAGLQDSPVLTLSDVVGFNDAGGMAQFFFERGELRFTIQPEAVRRSGLKMSSKLLTLGLR